MKNKILMLAFALAGCATIPKSEQVKLIASQDMKCASDKVTTTQVDAKTYTASACGKEATYIEQCPYSGSTRCTWAAQNQSDKAASTGGASSAE